MIREVLIAVESICKESGTVRWMDLETGQEFKTKPDDLVPQWAQAVREVEKLAAEHGLCDQHYAAEHPDTIDVLGVHTVVAEAGTIYRTRCYFRPALHQLMAHFDNYQPINGYVLVKPTAYEMRSGSLILAPDEATENRSMRHVFEVLKACESVTKVAVGDIIVKSVAANGTMYGKSLTSTVDTSFNEYILLHEDDIAAIAHRTPRI